MCIMFLYVNPNAEEGKYQLILANNRDEFYDRPTEPAKFWENDQDCISGLDLMAEREGGTWLAVSKKGKIGVLLNLLTETGPLPDKKARGNLVKDFVAGSLSATEYLQQFVDTGPDYNSFNLFCSDLKSDGHLHYYSNSESESRPKVLPSGVYGVGNSVLSKPFKKTCSGKDQFTKIIEDYGNPEQADILIEKLWQLMSDETSYLPDEQMQKQGGKRLNAELLSQKSRIFIRSPSIRYGTRTTTLVLIDKSGRCEYLEKNIREPIDIDNPVWDLRKFSFSMHKEE